METRIDTTPIDEIGVALENMESIHANLTEFGVTPSVKALLLQDPVLGKELEGLEDDEYLPAVEGLMDKIIDKFKSIFKNRSITVSGYKQELAKWLAKSKERDSKGRVPDTLIVKTVVMKAHVKDMKAAIARFKTTKDMLDNVMKFKGDPDSEKAVVMMTKLAHQGKKVVEAVGTMPAPKRISCKEAGIPGDMEAMYDQTLKLLNDMMDHTDEMRTNFQKLSKAMAKLWIKHDCGAVAYVIDKYIPEILLSDSKSSLKSIVMES